MEPGESTDVSYSLGVDESASNGVYNVPLTVEYENEAGSEFTREVTAGVTVGGQPDLEAGFSGSESKLTRGNAEPRDPAPHKPGTGHSGLRLHAAPGVEPLRRHRKSERLHR
nr:MAG: hypothetical protein J07AB56_08660 [Candidatus Nanosalinarum sp. J07AB56]